MPTPLRIQPMLALNYSQKLFKPGSWVQPKYDGFRMMWFRNNFISRDGVTAAPNRFEHLRKKLINIPPNLVLDGEFYIHQKSLAYISSAVAINSTRINHKEPELTFVVYDILDTSNPFQPFAQRYVDSPVLTTLEYVGLTLPPTQIVSAHEEVVELFQKHKAADYEGAMIRSATDAYPIIGLTLPSKRTTVRGRWLLKYKQLPTLTAKIVGFAAGDAVGKYANTLGVFWLDYNGLVFKCSPGKLTDADRDTIWANQSLYLNRLCEVQYETFAVSGEPLKRTFQRFL